MTQLTPHPAYVLIEDQLDAIGQKYRALRIAGGAMRWVIGAVASSLGAVLAAHGVGQGMLAWIILAMWLAFLAASAVWWVAIPLFLRPKPVEVARMVESRLDGIHNGLTNSVLLAKSDDLQESPWLDPIFDEVLGLTRTHNLSSAVRLSDLKPLAIRMAIILAAALILLSIPRVRSNLQQGLQQMLHPKTFVPKVGRIRLVDVSPQDITLVSGQPLEITVLAEDPDKGQPTARLVFDNPRMSRAELTPQSTSEDQLRYAYRLDHVEEPMRFRVEIAGTQSAWCQVNVVKQVRLTELQLSITPPAYTKKPPQTLTLKPDQIAKTPLTVPEGSRVEMSVVIDVPVKSALAQMDQEAPQPMVLSQDGRRFTAVVTVLRNVEVVALLNEGGQVIAKLPDPALRISCAPDGPPAIEMKWPTQDVAVSPKAPLKIHALLRDDYGLASARILMATDPDQPLAIVHEKPYADAIQADELTRELEVPTALRVHGRSIRVQLEATDNRNLIALATAGSGLPAKDAGPRTTSTPIYQITFRDPEEIAKAQQEQFDKLRQLLQEMIKKQQGLMALSVAWKPPVSGMVPINKGQVGLRDMMQSTAEGFSFQPDDKIVQKTLLVLVQNPAKDAIDLSKSIQIEPVAAEQAKLNKELQTRQRRIIDILETLVSKLNIATAPALAAGKNGGDLDNEREKLKELNEALKKFMAEEKRILDGTSTLAKKPVDNYDDNDKKLLEELKMGQEKLDAFMQEKISDFSKLAEQDMANASLLKEMLEVYSEVTMAKDALKKQAVEMAIPAEEMGMELAKEISSNLEKWLMNEPDRQKWNQEDPLTKQDIPMAELPKELEDMVGELMEQQEDLSEEMEDTAANWADSLDKGAGWDAADGPIASMSAKGVTGNQLPNNNEMNGRSGEGRSGKSTGEFVEETATGKGGRNTPTRLDPTPFQQGQIKDTSKDPVGGATGGGKISGQGGQGLEGPVPGKDLKEKMERLAGKQAELRNKTERLNLDKKVGRYDNFKLMEAVALMRRVESDIHANRYQTALRRKDILLDRLDSSHLLLSGQIHLQKDTTPTMSQKMQEQINDVTNGQLPAAWSEALKEYYKKLSEQK